MQVDLTNLDQNFDLTMFRDIGQTFTTLTNTQDLTKLERAVRRRRVQPVDLLAIDLQPIDLLPVDLQPIDLQPVDLLAHRSTRPSIYSPSIYSPSIYSPSIYSPSIYSPSIYSPSIYSPSDTFLQAFSSAQTRSLIGVSAHDNAEAESIRTATWNNTGDFYVRVQGRNGASSPTPFHLGLTTAGGPCAAVTLQSFSGLPTIAGAPGGASDGDPHRQLAPDSAAGFAAGARLSSPRSTGGVVADVADQPAHRRR